MNLQNTIDLWRIEMRHMSWWCAWYSIFHIYYNRIIYYKSSQNYLLLSWLWREGRPIWMKCIGFISYFVLEIIMVPINGHKNKHRVCEVFSPACILLQHAGLSVKRWTETKYLSLYRMNYAEPKSLRRLNHELGELLETEFFEALLSVVLYSYWQMSDGKDRTYSKSKYINSSSWLK